MWLVSSRSPFSSIPNLWLYWVPGNESLQGQSVSTVSDERQDTSDAALRHPAMRTQGYVTNLVYTHVRLYRAINKHEASEQWVKAK